MLMLFESAVLRTEHGDGNRKSRRYKVADKKAKLTIKWKRHQFQLHVTEYNRLSWNPCTMRNGCNQNQQQRKQQRFFAAEKFISSLQLPFFFCESALGMYCFSDYFSFLSIFLSCFFFTFSSESICTAHPHFSGSFTPHASSEYCF